MAAELKIRLVEIHRQAAKLGIEADKKGEIDAGQAARLRAEIDAGLREFPEPATEKSSTFLLRLTPELRTQLEKFRETTQAKSLQGLLLQVIGEGLARQGDFTAADLFSKDLHVRTLSAAVGGSRARDFFVGDYSLTVKGTTARFEPFDIATLLAAHERVIQELVNQRLTGFAALMDPALMAFRILLQAAVGPFDAVALKSDFSTGLSMSAEHAMKLNRWGLAETLLVQALEVDPYNQELAIKTGVFLLQRLLRRWERPSDHITPGVTNGLLVSGDWVQPGGSSSAKEEDDVDETSFGTAERIFGYFHRTVGEREEPARRLLQERGAAESELPFVLVKQFNLLPRTLCWSILSKIVYGLTHPDEHALKKFIEMEPTMVKSMVDLLSLWERGFRMSREVATLQREWREWLEIVEVLWWLGYRQEAFSLANEVRGFASDKSTTERFNLLRRWNPKDENLEPYFDGLSAPYIFKSANEWDDEHDPKLLEPPVPLFNRPDGV
jgi:hypothetical protein